MSLDASPQAHEEPTAIVPWGGSTLCCGEQSFHGFGCVYPEDRIAQQRPIAIRPIEWPSAGLDQMAAMASLMAGFL